MIEKILSEIDKLIESNEEEANACYPSAMAREYAYHECKEIVQEVAKEYGNDWIPVEERIPIHNGWYLVTNELGVVQQLYWGANHWHKLRDEAVVAWMELPAPYQKGE